MFRKFYAAITAHLGFYPGSTYQKGTDPVGEAYSERLQFDL